MASGEKSLPQRSDEPVQDFQLVQVLHATRTTAAKHEGAGWDDLGRTAGRLLDRMSTSHGGEPFQNMGMDRINRDAFTIEPELANRVVAALLALDDRPDDLRLERARTVIDELDAALG